MSRLLGALVLDRYAVVLLVQLERSVVADLEHLHVVSVMVKNGTVKNLAEYRYMSSEDDTTHRRVGIMQADQTVTGDSMDLEYAHDAIVFTRFSRLPQNYIHRQASSRRLTPLSLNCFLYSWFRACILGCNLFFLVYQAL